MFGNWPRLYLEAEWCLRLLGANQKLYLDFTPFLSPFPGDSSKVTTVVATPGQGPDRPQEVSYSDIKVIGNGSFGVVYQARLADSGELVAIKKVLQDKRFKVSWRRWGCRSVFTFADLLLGFWRSS